MKKERKKGKEKGGKERKKGKEKKKKGRKNKETIS